MLTQIDLKHFKCFRTLKLPLGSLTLLSGANATGKSSVMQALALMHQTMREYEWSTSLILNGESVRLGSVADVVDEVHGRREFEISLLDDHRKSYRWKLKGDPHDISMVVTAVSIDGVPKSDETGLKALRYLLPPIEFSSKKKDSVRIKDFTRRIKSLAYLTAERVGPKETYSLQDPQLTPVVGSRGENAISILFFGRDQRVLDGLVIEGTPPTRLRQIEAQMKRFFPRCELSIDGVDRTNSLMLGLRTSKSVRFHRPVNTGFGLTQVLPIIIAALSAERNDLLLVENPEVHLHPAGQARMGLFLAETARAGVQVVLETHSDHVLNGIRLAVKRNILDSDKAVLHFFNSRQEDSSASIPQVISPRLDHNANIDYWPPGFFDQFDTDLGDLIDWN